MVLIHFTTTSPFLFIRFKPGDNITREYMTVVSWTRVLCGKKWKLPSHKHGRWWKAVTTMEIYDVVAGMLKRIEEAMGSFSMFRCTISASRARCL